MKLTQDPGFFFGAGLMGVLAGLGLGSKSPNKYALILGLAALYRANQLYPLVDIKPTKRLQDEFPDPSSLVPRQVRFLQQG